jgi:hypothetical protein
MARRTVAIILGLFLCVSLAGCTMTAYFGGWAKIGGTVVTLDTDGMTHLPLAGVQVTLTPLSQSDVAHNFISGVDGRWLTSYWLKRDAYIVTFALDGYNTVTATEELAERWEIYEMEPVVMRPSED